MKVGHWLRYSMIMLNRIWSSPSNVVSRWMYRKKRVRQFQLNLCVDRYFRLSDRYRVNLSRRILGSWASWCNEGNSSPICGFRYLEQLDIWGLRCLGCNFTLISTWSSRFHLTQWISFRSGDCYFCPWGFVRQWKQWLSGSLKEWWREKRWWSWVHVKRLEALGCSGWVRWESNFERKNITQGNVALGMEHSSEDIIIHRLQRFCWFFRFWWGELVRYWTMPTSFRRWKTLSFA